MDPIADMLNNIKNASSGSKEFVSVPYSKIKFNIIKILEKEGYVKSVAVSNDKKFGKRLEIGLSYRGEGESRAPKINRIWRVSKPSKKVYKSFKDLTPVNQGYGLAIISSNKGLKTDKEAKREKVGGEVMFKIW